jgi:RimJ/RimL family protein N-acetyltransferase
MLRGMHVALRARYPEDVEILHDQLQGDVETRSRADSRPWRPISPGSAASPYAVVDPSDDLACFSVVELDGSALVGEALLWGIDLHNRCAHIGLSLLPAVRGRGLGGDVVRVLCDYGFRIRGLHRLQVDTLSDNEPMIRAAQRAGFVSEGITRRSAWVAGTFVNETVLGLLADEWRPSGG